MKKVSLLFLCFICSLLLAVDDNTIGEDEICVHLNTQKVLIPIYLAEFLNESSLFSEGYLKKLEEVLSFDLNYNGRTELIAHQRVRNAQIITTHADFIYDAQAWKKLGVFYVVVCRIRNSTVYLELFCTSNKHIEKLDLVVLSGDLNMDRRKMHELADQLTLLLFDQKGIASSKILYTVKLPNTDPSSRYPWISEVWECDYDGHNAWQVTFENNFCVTPIYVPEITGEESKDFIYVSYKIGQPKLYRASLQGGEASRITSLRGNQLMPMISSGTDQLVFINDASGNPEIVLLPFHYDLGAIGKPRQIFKCSTATQASPVFSPNGRQVAFVSSKDGSPRIYVMDLHTLQKTHSNKAVTLITKCNRENTSPAWSPDGTKLAYSSWSKGVRQIWVYDFEEKIEKQLTTDSNNKENPTWASDSLHLVFNTSDRSSCELYLMTLRQSTAVKITSGRGDKRFPSFNSEISHPIN